MGPNWVTLAESYQAERASSIIRKTLPEIGSCVLLGNFRLKSPNKACVGGFIENDQAMPNSGPYSE